MPAGPNTTMPNTEMTTDDYALGSALGIGCRIRPKTASKFKLHIQNGVPVCCKSQRERKAPKNMVSHMFAIWVNRHGATRFSEKKNHS
jgi:hypothetical protein